MDDQTLDAYAQVVLEVGIGLEAGQRLAIQGYDGGLALEAAPFVHRIVERAYDLGARDVRIFWEDAGERAIRLRRQPEAELGEHPAWVGEAFNEHARAGDPILIVDAVSPAPAGASQERLDIHRRAIRRLVHPARQLRGEHKVQWLIAGWPTADWAGMVFPDLDPAEGLRRLETAVAHAARADAPDPVGAWRSWVAQLAARATWLNEQGFTAVRFRGPGTDLEVGLVDGHVWEGGASATPEGRVFVPNVPTEEVFTMPHRLRTEGVVAGTMPAAIGGRMVEGWELEFRGGEIVRVRADEGEDVLRSVVDTDEGSRRLGEVALVPVDSATAQTGVLFRHILYDENASCHIAVGDCYPGTIAGGGAMSPEELLAAGGNASVEHTDVMIGSAAVDVAGVHVGGDETPLLARGLWVGG